MSTKSSLSKQQQSQSIPVKNEMEKYQVIKLLGEGSFGRVYKAKVISDSSFVALKVISKVRRSNREIIGLRRECEIQRHLHHPNIIQMHDSFETASEIVVVTEFAHKELNSVLSKETYLSEERACPIIWDLVSALNYLHSHRVLHRDLKPQNVLIDSNNKAKLCDFGFARNMSVRTHVLTSIKGTPLYMAPELMKEQPYDYKADLWSLGCIMFEVLVGSPPFCTTNLLRLCSLLHHQEIQWPNFVSEHCNSFLKGLLHKDPARRINWEEILNHPFVNGHILISDDSSNNKPLTRAESANTLQAKEKQRNNHISNKNHGNKLVGGLKSPQGGFKKSDSQDTKNKNSLGGQFSNVSLGGNPVNSISSSKPNVSSQASGATEKFSLIEESHPLETDEWIVFLRKSMEEVIHGETMSLTQSSLTNIIVSPLRNSNTSPKVLSHVAKLLSLPFVITELPPATLEQVKKVYLEVKLVPNLIYSFKLFLRIKREETPGLSASLESHVASPDIYSDINDLSEEDFECLEYIFMLITHLVHLESEFLAQLCDAFVVLKVSSLLHMLLYLGKNNLQVVTDLMSLLTHILRIFPENSDLVEKIILHEDKSVSFIEFLRHSDPILRERVCFFLLFLGKTLPTTKMEILWSGDVTETLEALMYDSIESVRNAAEKTVEELKNKDFFKETIGSK